MRWGERRSGLVAIVGFLLVVSACSDDTTGANEPNPATAAPADCSIPDGPSLQPGESAALQELGTVDGVRISAAVYPHPDYDGNPWSQWGQGIALEDGRFYSAIGDHLGPDGNSYIYEYDPDSNELTLVGDILSYVDHVPGTWGYGKVHSQMVPGPCGEIYFSTYWGTSRDLEFGGNYRGDIIFRLDPYGRTLNPLDVPVEFHGQASLAANPSAGLIFGEAVDPITRGEARNGPLFVYDVRTEEVVYTSPALPHIGFRSVLVDGQGNAFYSVGDGRLNGYDSQNGQPIEADFELPGEWLRAVTNVSPDGTVYGVTREPDRFFALDSGDNVRPLGDALGYTASVALNPEGTVFYYMPGAHGNSSDWGSPVVAVDTTSGDQTILVELNDTVESEMGYTVGGTYNIAVSPDGTTLYMGANVGEVGSDSTFEEVILLVIELP